MESKPVAIALLEISRAISLARVARVSTTPMPISTKSSNAPTAGNCRSESPPEPRTHASQSANRAPGLDGFRYSFGLDQRTGLRSQDLAHPQHVNATPTRSIVRRVTSSRIMLLRQRSAKGRVIG